MQELVKRQMCKIDFVELYEFCFSSYNQKGTSVSFSRAIAYIVKMYNALYRQVISEITPAKNPKIDEYNIALHDLEERMADRDPNGNVIKLQNGRAQIRENVIEYNKEFQVLSEKYKSDIETYNESLRSLDPKKMEMLDLNLRVIYPEDVDKTLPPHIIGLLF